MGTFIFLVAVVVEIIFTAFCIITRSNQGKVRSIIRIMAFITFVLISILSIIDWGLTYYSIAGLLFIMAVIGAITLLGKKEDKKAYKTVRIVWKAIGITVLIFILTLPAIIFPTYKGIETTGKYQVAAVFYSLTDKNRVETYTSTGENRKLNVEMWYPKNAHGTYPLVVFSHGSFGIKESNESLYNELASHGYVVCSIDHTYQCFSTTDNSGHTVSMDSGYRK